MRSTRIPRSSRARRCVTATVFFAFQIYCDFSGYTDTARGVARMLGFELMRNFNFPYISKTPVEFWQRWHISLSQWFQDYLYYPLAMRYMRRGGFFRKYKAHIISMALIGLWHGANWTFLVVRPLLGRRDRDVSRGSGPYRGRDTWRSHRSACARSCRARGISAAIAVMFTLVCIGWVFFRAESIGDAWYVLTHVFSFSERFRRHRRRSRGRADSVGADRRPVPRRVDLSSLRSHTPQPRGWPVPGHRRSLRVDRGDHSVRRGIAARRRATVHLLPVLDLVPASLGYKRPRPPVVRALALAGKIRT